ncbi:MAG TPA: I78 family peptidase inhibitor [Sphingomicrobium sp.]|nr:I78 family peptidase inhibitor [Sphingomicrobium sp.]
MRHLVTLSLLPLAACTVAESTATGGPITSPGYPAVCSNEPLGQFVGQPASQELGERILRASGARTLRWVPKGGVVTMDYREDRVTIYLDGSNRVERASCG